MRVGGLCAGARDQLGVQAGFVWPDLASNHLALLGPGGRRLTPLSWRVHEDVGELGLLLGRRHYHHETSALYRPQRSRLT